MGIVLKYRSRVCAGTAWQLVHQAEGTGGAPVLLVAGETTAQAREILERHDISVAGGLGNAHIQVPGLLFHREGRRPRIQARPARLTGKAGAAAQALLLNPDAHGRSRTWRGWPGCRWVTGWPALLDLWAGEDTPQPARTLGYLLAASPRQLVHDVSQGLDGARIAHAVTGAAAAQLAVPQGTAVPVAEVWVSAATAPGELHAATGPSRSPMGTTWCFSSRTVTPRWRSGNVPAAPG